MTGAGEGRIVAVAGETDNDDSGPPGSKPRSVKQHARNDKFRAARLSVPSPNWEGEGLSRQELAEAINKYLYEKEGRTGAIEAHYIAKIERGAVACPRQHYRAAFRSILGVASDSDLGFHPSARGGTHQLIPRESRQDHGSSSDVHPTAISAPPAASGQNAEAAIRSDHAEALDDWQDPGFEAAKLQASRAELVRMTASESARFGLRHIVLELNSSNMEQVSEEVRRLGIEFSIGDPIQTFMRSRQLRNDIFELLSWRTLPQQEVMLYRYAARTCGYLAAASSDFFGEYDAASDQCRAARRFAEMAEDAEMQAWVYGLHSGVSFWRGHWKQAADLAEKSLVVAETRSGVMRATAMMARAFARVGDVGSIQKVLLNSESSTVSATSDDEHGMILFSEKNYLRCIGTAHLWSGRTHQASDLLVNALDQYLAEDPPNVAVIAVIRADIAMASLADNDVESAANALDPILSATHDLRLEGSARRMRDIRRTLQASPFSASSEAREMADKIEVFLTGSANLP